MEDTSFGLGFVGGHYALRDVMTGRRSVVTIPFNALRATYSLFASINTRCIFSSVVAFPTFSETLPDDHLQMYY